MIRRWRADRRGASAVEFALVVPLLLTFLFGALELAIVLWTYNVLQESASEAARCSALRLAACATVTGGCDSANATICYAEAVATQRGITTLTASMVTVNAAVTTSGVSFTTVTIAKPYGFLSYTGTLTATGMFPNAP